MQGTPSADVMQQQLDEAPSCPLPCPLLPRLRSRTGSTPIANGTHVLCYAVPATARARAACTHQPGDAQRAPPRSAPTLCTRSSLHRHAETCALTRSTHSRARPHAQMASLSRHTAQSTTAVPAEVAAGSAYMALAAATTEALRADVIALEESAAEVACRDPRAAAGRCRRNT